MSAPAEHYPIEVTFPDISIHKESGSGIPYVHTFDSGVPGEHVMINALTHGNEVCGAIVVDALLRLKTAAAARPPDALVRERRGICQLRSVQARRRPFRRSGLQPRMDQQGTRRHVAYFQ